MSATARPVRPTKSATTIAAELEAQAEALKDQAAKLRDDAQRVDDIRHALRKAARRLRGGNPRG